MHMTAPAIQIRHLVLFALAALRPAAGIAQQIPALPAAPVSEARATVGAATAPAKAPIPLAFALPGAEGLNATLWMQHAAEARIAAKQAYFAATRQLDAALRDSSWSAATEQVQPYKKLKPAIILDLDETVLDNSPFQSSLVRGGGTYSNEAWMQWVTQSAAQALPGAIKFLHYANKRGVQIFFVSNRGKAEEAATRENLRRLGCPVQGPDDHVLMNGEQPDWTSDKSSRRRFVSQNHRVVLLVGDDLNDFVSAKSLTEQQRLEIVDKYDAYWGERWIILSNPAYGSWESAVLNNQRGLTTEQVLRLKYEALQTSEQPKTPPAP